MNLRDFVETIDDEPCTFTRTDLLTMEVMESYMCVPNDPRFIKDGVSIRVQSIHFYTSDTLVSRRGNKVIAVVKTDSGNMFLDTFEIIGGSNGDSD